MPCVLAVYSKYIAVVKCGAKFKFLGKFDAKKKADEAVIRSKCMCKSQRFSGP